MTEAEPARRELQRANFITFVSAFSAAQKCAFALAFAGLVLSGVLEYVHYRAYTAPSRTSFCTLGERLDCASVALSKYSLLLGVPVPLWGVLGFATLLATVVVRSRWLLPLAGVAALGSLGLLALELTAIGAVCLLCEGVHAVSLGLLFAAVRVQRQEGGALRPLKGGWPLLAPGAGTLLALALFLPRYWGAFGWKGALPYAHGVTPEGDHWIGASEPKLTVEEFVDYSCPLCKAATARTLRLLGQHPTGLRIVRRYFPHLQCTANDRESCLALRIVLCAGEQDKFWQADRWLFAHVVYESQLEPAQAARDIGLEPSRLDACLGRDDTYARAAEAWNRARKLRIPGTPYYLTGKKAVPESELSKLLRAL